MEPLPRFDDAVAELRRFLRSQKQADQIAWAFREDIIFTSVELVRVKWPLSDANESIARGRFEAGRRRG